MCVEVVLLNILVSHLAPPKTKIPDFALVSFIERTKF